MKTLIITIMAGGLLTGFVLSANAQSMTLVYPANLQDVKNAGKSASLQPRLMQQVGNPYQFRGVMPAFEMMLDANQLGKPSTLTGK